MKIYIDSECRCHAENADGLTAVETDFFSGMCKEYIEGYRFVPAGTVWEAEDGTAYHGEMIAPWRPWAALNEAQMAYEHGIISELSEGEGTMKAEEIVEKVKADRTMCDVVARAGITVEAEPELPPNRPGLRWIPYQAKAGGPITWVESEYDASMPGTSENPIAFEAGLTVYPNYFYRLDGVRKVWTGETTTGPEWSDIWFVEM